MSDVRKDPLLDRWVVMAAGRADRPGAFIESPAFDPSLPCPFCEGHEAETPPEVLAFRESQAASLDTPHWRVRVVPNKFPAIVSGNGAAAVGAGLFQRFDGCGAHEVIIESPRHVASVSDLTVAELTEVFLACQMRLAEWKRDLRMAYGQLFKNVGLAAGASLEHAHSQLLIVPRVPSLVAAEMAGALDYFRSHGRCPFCDMICEELAVGQRIVEATPHHLALVPFAARLPYETWILPKVHASHYEETPREQLADFAGVVRAAIERLEAAVGRCAYNYALHTTPFADGDLAHFHWHLEIVPVIVRPAGFELGTGWFINPVPPETAAKTLREAN